MLLVTCGSPTATVSGQLAHKEPCEQYHQCRQIASCVVEEGELTLEILQCSVVTHRTWFSEQAHVTWLGHSS